jgi:hypothetical protein
VILVDSILDPPVPGAVPEKASQLDLVRCSPVEARACVGAWHSRLPVTQRGPWMLAFSAVGGDHVYGAALWHNPSARGLPQNWMELRRLAIPDYAPPHTASWMLGAMRKWIRANRPDTPRLLSYQDIDVHLGTIYKAAGWEIAYFSKPRLRSRNVGLGTRDGRAYRTDSNGTVPAGSGKYRWEVAVR